MRHPRALLCLALVAAAAGLAAGQNLTAAKRAAGQPALDAAVSAAKAVGGAKYAAYTAVNDATRPAKAAAASIINAKFQAPSALARAKLVAAGDAASAAVDAKAAVAKPILQKVVSKVAPALSAANDAADSVKDATYGAAKTAVGSLLASKINATSEQVDRLVAAKLSKVMPFVNKYGGEVNAKVEQIANADDAAMAALLKAPSDKFVGLYEATVTEGNPIRTATYPIHQVVDEALDTLNRVQDGPVKQALAPLHSKVSAGLEKLAIRLEGPVAKQVAAPRAAIRGVVAKVSDFVDGPGYNISAPVRTVVNHAIMGVANFVEGNHSEWQAEPTPGAGRFVNDIGNFVGNNLMVPGVGRVASAMFGIIPKPTPRNPNLPGRPTDPVYPRALPTNPKNEPSGTCKPWAPPEGYRNVLDYCKAMQSKPKSYFANMWNKTTPPVKGQEFPLSGCVFGCLVGGVDDAYVRAQIETSIMFGWSGKCFGEERKDGVPTKFATTLNHDYLIPSGRTNEQRVPAYTGAGDMIFIGQGKYNPKGYYDGLPAWHFDDERPNITMFTAGSWRTLNTLFQAWADGVVDEFRDLGKGAVIGKTFYTPPVYRGRVRADTNFFMLMQACSKDLKYAWKPEDRAVPQIGDP